MVLCEETAKVCRRRDLVEMLSSKFYWTLQFPENSNQLPIPFRHTVNCLHNC